MRKKPFQTKFRRHPEKWRSIVGSLRDLEKRKGIEAVLDIISEDGENLERISETKSKDSWNIDIEDTQIQTEQQLIDSCDIDLDEWELVEFKKSCWPQKSKTDGITQLHSVKGRFKRREVSGIEKLITRAEGAMYDYQAPEFRPVLADSNFCSIINLYDAHLDKVTRYTETGEESDIWRNCELFNGAFDYLLSSVGDTGEIILPIGNDLFNINDARGTTKKGTHQDTYLHHVDTFEIILNLIRDTIEKAANIAPVCILMIPGNHDEDLVHLLGVVLNSIYKKSKTIEIDYSRQWRKYKQWGDNMFMFAHGNNMKSKISQIPHIIAQERKEMWANTIYRYAFFGDIHHKNEYQFKRGKDFIGVNVKFLRSISAGDVWHHKKGYIGVEKTAELYNVSKCGRFFNEVKYSF